MKNMQHWKVRHCMIALVLSCILLTGCGYQTRTMPEIMEGIKWRLSYDESLGRINYLGYAGNIIAANCLWEEADFGASWFPRSPKLADHISIANEYDGAITLYWRETHEGEDFYQSLNDMAVANGYEYIDEGNVLFFTDDLIRKKYKFHLEEVEKEYYGWGHLDISLTIEWERTESDLAYNISAIYRLDWNEDEELTQQKKEEQDNQ